MLVERRAMRQRGAKGSATHEDAARAASSNSAQYSEAESVATGEEGDRPGLRVSRSDQFGETNGQRTAT